MDIAVDTSIEPGKLFVGGLSWDTKELGFKEYFSKYGEILDAKIMEDQTTKKPRGFGFITFKDPTSVSKVLSEPTHIIDNKKVDPKQATLRPPPNTPTKTKVFVGGLPTNCTADELYAVFAPFGTVTNVDIKGDAVSQHGQPAVPNDRNRGFGFVDFENSEVVDKLVGMQYIQVNGKKVEIKRAEPRGKHRTMPQQDATPSFHPSHDPMMLGGNYGAMGRGMGNNVATGTYPSHYQSYHSYQPNYAAAAYQNYTPAGHGQYAAQFDYYGRGAYGGHQPMTSYQDASSYSQGPRGTFGSTSEQYSGATGFGYEHPTAYATYTDQSGGMNYATHSAATQQRTGFMYSRS